MSSRPFKGIFTVADAAVYARRIPRGTQLRPQRSTKRGGKTTSRAKREQRGWDAPAGGYTQALIYRVRPHAESGTRDAARSV